MIRNRLAQRRFRREWDAAARDVRSALAAATVDMVNRELEHAHITGQTAGEITAQIWGDMTDRMYPTKKEP